MSGVRKYVLKPFESEKQSDNEHSVNIEHNYAQRLSQKEEKTAEKPKLAKNAIKERARLKMENILKIITSLASVKGYDSQRRIKSSTGKYVSETDIIDLIMHAMQPGKVLKGEEEFIKLLSEANVDPNWLFNENVKSKLRNNKNSEFGIEEPNVIKQTESAPLYVEKTSPIAPKRKNIEDDDKQISTKKRKLNWDYSDDE